MTNKGYLDMAYLYATHNSGCLKVAVGSAIVKGERILSFGVNRAVPNLCKYRGCLRMEKYGDDSKNHRNPEDCRAIHSEIDAICSAASDGISVKGASIFVTRYPCEGCAKAIVAAGIRFVYYGGTALISSQTAKIFEQYDVECIHVPDWKEDLSDR